MEVLDKDKLALDRVEKEKLAKLEQRLAFAPSESSYAAPETDVFSDDDAADAGASTTDARKKKRKNFTEEEDAKLLEAYQQFPGQWEVIVARAGLDRTTQQCQNRMKRLKKVKEESSPLHAPTPAPVTPAHTAMTPVPLAPSPVAAAAAAPKVGTRQATIMEKFGGGNHSNNNALAGLGSSSPVSAAVADWKRKLDEQRQKTMEALEALKAVHERAEAAEAETDVTKTLYKKELMAQLRARARQEFEEARKDLAMKSLRYGTVKWERHANQVQEMWHQGTVYEELRSKETALLEDEKNVMGLRNDLKARKKIKNVPGALSKLEMDEQDEIYAIQLAQIKKRLDELRVAFDSLQSDLALHKKELKRVRDEDESRFKNHPLLHERYVLLKLVGKGGFSEVFKVCCVVPFYSLVERFFKGVRFDDAQVRGGEAAPDGALLAREEKGVLHEARPARVGDSKERSAPARRGRVRQLSD